MRYEECAYGIVSTAMVPQLNGRDQQACDGKMSMIQLSQYRASGLLHIGTDIIHCYCVKRCGMGKITIASALDNIAQFVTCYLRS